jgi:hypothetical protein
MQEVLRTSFKPHRRRTVKKKLRPLFATSISHCRFCDAAVENNAFQHDPNCLSNIPGPYAECSPFWFRGRNHGDRPSGMTDLQKHSYEMGQNMSPVPFTFVQSEEMALASAG